MGRNWKTEDTEPQTWWCFSSFYVGIGFFELSHVLSSLLLVVRLIKCTPSSQPVNINIDRLSNISIDINIDALTKTNGSSCVVLFCVASEQILDEITCLSVCCYFPLRRNLLVLEGCILPVKQLITKVCPFECSSYVLCSTCSAGNVSRALEVLLGQASVTKCQCDWLCHHVANIAIAPWNKHIIHGHSKLSFSTLSSPSPFPHISYCVLLRIEICKWYPVMLRGSSSWKLTQFRAVILSVAVWVGSGRRKTRSLCSRLIDVGRPTCREAGTRLGLTHMSSDP